MLQACQARGQAANKMGRLLHSLTSAFRQELIYPLPSKVFQHRFKPKFIRSSQKTKSDVALSILQLRNWSLWMKITDYLTCQMQMRAPSPAIRATEWARLRLKCEGRQMLTRRIHRTCICCHQGKASVTLTLRTMPIQAPTAKTTSSQALTIPQAPKTKKISLSIIKKCSAKVIHPSSCFRQCSREQDP